MTEKKVKKSVNSLKGRAQEFSKRGNREDSIEKKGKPRQLKQKQGQTKIKGKNETPGWGKRRDPLRDDMPKRTPKASVYRRGKLKEMPHEDRKEMQSEMFEGEETLPGKHIAGEKKSEARWRPLHLKNKIKFRGRTIPPVGISSQRVIAFI